MLKEHFVVGQLYAICIHVYITIYLVQQSNFGKQTNEKQLINYFLKFPLPRWVTITTLYKLIIFTVTDN